MSGGSFDYIQYRIENDIPDKIHGYFDSNPDVGEDATTNICLTIVIAKAAGKLLHHLYYFMAGDSGEESYNEKVKASLKEISLLSTLYGVDSVLKIKK